jgi:hypothetical protein
MSPVFFIKSLAGRWPAGVSESACNNGLARTVTAHCNVRFSLSHTSREAMHSYGQQVEKRLQGEVDAGIFEWIWDRLAETGPHGKRYTDRFRQAFRVSMH